MNQYDRQPPVVVTRHPALLEYLLELGLVGPDAAVIEHATPDDVRGRHVFGVLPLSLAQHAARITEIPLDLPRELRGQELSIEQLRQHAGEPATYVVVRLHR